ncbi:hypothetical protein SAMN06272771_7409 [Streptomyces sp. Ag82_O1-12]|nr:hypothetical protein SAMN06272771_7409 [Streptomyces sp. Ag82_O1-12]SOD49914.1 hypothetical protein SAMN06272727_7416 [Streptomyces sp. Ag82_G6-1]
MASTFRVGGGLDVRRLGFGAMHLPTGPGPERENALAVARRRVEVRRTAAVPARPGPAGPATAANGADRPAPAAPHRPRDAARRPARHAARGPDRGPGRPDRAVGGHRRRAGAGPGARRRRESAEPLPPARPGARGGAGRVRGGRGRIPAVAAGDLREPGGPKSGTPPSRPSSGPRPRRSRRPDSSTALRSSRPSRARPGSSTWRKNLAAADLKLTPAPRDRHDGSAPRRARADPAPGRHLRGLEGLTARGGGALPGRRGGAHARGPGRGVRADHAGTVRRAAPRRSRPAAVRDEGARAESG